jgi:hypothetical protein
MYTLYNTQGYKTHNIYIIIRDSIFLALWKWNPPITCKSVVQLFQEHITYESRGMHVLSCDFMGEFTIVDYLNTTVLWKAFLLYMWEPLGSSFGSETSHTEDLFSLVTAEATTLNTTVAYDCLFMTYLSVTL